MAGLEQLSYRYARVIAISTTASGQLCCWPGDLWLCLLHADKVVVVAVSISHHQRIEEVILMLAPCNTGLRLLDGGHQRTVIICLHNKQNVTISEDFMSKLI